MSEQKLYVIATPYECEKSKIWTSITEDQIKKIGEIVGVDDFLEDISSGIGCAEIRKITPLESVKSSLNGASLDGANSTEGQIRYMLDNGVTDCEMEILNLHYLPQLEIAKSKTFDELEG